MNEKSSTRKKQRKSFFKVLDPQLQRDLYWYLGILWVAWAMILAINIALIRLIDIIAIENSSEKTAFVIAAFLVTSSLMVLSSLLVFNHFLNRITGPLHRIQIQLESWQNGSSPQQRIQLRKDDYFTRLSELINLQVFGSTTDASSPPSTKTQDEA